MKTFLIILSLLFLTCLSSIAEDQKTEKKEADKPSSAVEKDNKNGLREPFILKLKLDKNRFYEQKIDKKTPYVADNKVNLFAGESFGVNVTIDKGEITRLSYQKDIAKSDIEFEFKQEADKDGGSMMMLVIINKLKQTLYLDAVMTVPEKTESVKAEILPVEPGLSGNEMWPNPIIQLVMTNFRFNENAVEKPKTAQKNDAVKAPEQKTDPKKVGKLKIGNILYEDRNGDGRVDYESREENPGAEAFLYYKIDDNFDGFYEREVKVGGADGKQTEKKLHEQVSPVKGLKYPNP
ncbi:MAG TPA: hypothetical protein DET40_06250 [Lentisphaeria bacterium]|nr:MAG: hypothetical protein A2X45_17880 [Lentisphaerae bacterium GWF2_50_93]HCE43128.1 hypothetical protein [Lentisphaeria bacterium]